MTGCVRITALAKNRDGSIQTKIEASGMHSSCGKVSNILNISKNKHRLRVCASIPCTPDKESMSRPLPACLHLSIFFSFVLVELMRSEHINCWFLRVLVQHAFISSLSFCPMQWARVPDLEIKLVTSPFAIFSATPVGGASFLAPNAAASPG